MLANLCHSSLSSLSLSLFLSTHTHTPTHIKYCTTMVVTLLTFEYLMSIWSLGILTLFSLRKPLSKPKKPSLGPMSPTVTPKHTCMCSYFIINLSFDDYYTSFMIINYCSCTWQGSVVFQAPQLNNESMNAIVHTFCYQPGQ